MTHQNRPNRWLVPAVLLGLDAFVLGAFGALLSVNSLLERAANAYATYDMDAASAVLDLIDDLLAYLAPCAGLLFLLVLTTVAVGVCRYVKVQTVRYSITALLLAVVLLSAVVVGVWVWKVSQPSTVPPALPTPTPAEGAFWKPQSTEHLCLTTRYQQGVC